MSGGLISSVGERDLWHHRVAHEMPITKCALHTVMLSASMSFHLLLSMAPLRSTLIVFGEQFCGEATYPSIINRYCQMRYYSARFVCALFMTAKLNNGPLAGRCKPLTKTHIRRSSTSNLSA